VTDVDEARPRIVAFRCLLNERGVEGKPLLLFNNVTATHDCFAKGRTSDSLLRL
jgi:hypothetical protein